MQFDYMRLPAAEAERLCYAEGFENAAKLFARIEALQHALGQATAEIETLKNTAADLKIKTFECEVLESELTNAENQNADMHAAINRACDVIMASPLGAKQILETI
jgi:ribosome-associated translation inhibitor RaiA